MMTFNSFTVTNDYNFGAQWPNDGDPRFVLPTEKTFSSHREITSKGVVISFCI